MDLIESMMTQKSIRRYSDQPVTDDEIRQCLSAAMQNFMLAARGLGIGTCLTTMFRIFQDEVRAVCDIPKEYEIEALIPMGRPRGKFGVAPRRPAAEVTSWNTFGNYLDANESGAS